MILKLSNNLKDWGVSNESADFVAQMIEDNYFIPIHCESGLILTPHKTAIMREAAIPLVKFLSENCHPHVYVIVDPTGAELVEGITRIKIEQFIKD